VTQKSFNKKENSQEKQEKSSKGRDLPQPSIQGAVHIPHPNQAVESMEDLEARTWNNLVITIPINLALLMIPMSQRTSLRLQLLNLKRKQLSQSTNHNPKRRGIMRKKALLMVLNQILHQKMRTKRKRKIRKMWEEVSTNLKRQKEQYKVGLHNL